MNKDDDDTLELEGFGARVRSKGREALVATLVILFVFLGWVHDTREHQDIIAVATSMSREHNELKAVVNELVFVSTLTDAQKEKINLVMPDSLREKLRRQRELQ